MIRSFKHRGLERFFETGSKAGIQPGHEARLRQILTVLDAANSIDAVDIDGWALHPLKGVLAGHWAVKVNRNWRVTFRFLDGEAEVIDYQDYH